MLHLTVRCSLFQVVDTSGQDNLSILPAAYAANVHGYMLVYSVSSSTSFQVVQVIYQRLLSTSGLQPGRFPVVLVANKSDLDDPSSRGTEASLREVSIKAGRDLAARWGAGFIETSAKNDVNVMTAFEMVAARLKEVDDGRPRSMMIRAHKVLGGKKGHGWWRKFSCASSSDTLF
jgi:Ras family protein